MMGFVFRLIPPRPDFMSRLSDDERATMTSQVLGGAPPGLPLRPVARTFALQEPFTADHA